MSEKLLSYHDELGPDEEDFDPRINSLQETGDEISDPDSNPEKEDSESENYYDHLPETDDNTESDSLDAHLVLKLNPDLSTPGVLPFNFSLASKSVLVLNDCFVYIHLLPHLHN